MISAATGTDVIAAAPSAVVVAERLDVARAIADRDVTVVTDPGHTAAESRDQHQSGACQHTWAGDGAHFAVP
jgi:hypothetical protein